MEGVGTIRIRNWKSEVHEKQMYQTAWEWALERAKLCKDGTHVTAAMKRRFRRYQSFAFAALLHSFTIGNGLSETLVEGVFAWHSYRGVTEFVLSKSAFSMRVEEVGSNWKIKTVPMEGSAVGQVDYWEVSHIGGEIAYYLRIGRNAGNGMFEISSIPVDYVGNRILPVWLAFASRSYFSNSSDSKFPNVHLASYWPQYDFRASSSSGEWSFLDETRSFLERLELIAEEMIYPIKRDGRLEVIRYPVPAPFDPGYVACRYHVVESSSLEGVQVPVRGVYETFSVSEFPDGSPAILKRTAYCEITVTNMVRELENMTTNHVQFAGTASVDDRRFIGEAGSGTPISLQVVDGDWPARDDERTQRSISRHEENAAIVAKLGTPIQNGARRLVAVIVVLGMLVAGFAVTWNSWNR